jgi:ribosomal protein S27AE
MGYLQKVGKASCGNCGSSVYWSGNSRPSEWDCGKCQHTNKLKRLPAWPNVPSELYVGYDKSKLLKLYPVPPEHSGAPWAQPFSVRSFVGQASLRFGGCAYSTWKRGDVMGKAVYGDACDSGIYRGRDCHMLAGWSLGEPSCALWESVAALCQTEPERRFLRWYMELVRDREFPMLIPQARIGIAERRRPDFVLFVPLQYWKYKWYAVQLDKAHPQNVLAFKDGLRDSEIQKHGYEVISLRPESEGYLPAVKSLIEQIDADLEKAKSDRWGVAIEAEVQSCQVSIDIPF